jgi:2-dehydro-3-deoxyphosphogluconate aldolase/(4S)-4-hydroxy-2-oxoglutarate aldolase
MPQNADALLALLTRAPVIPVIVLDDLRAARPVAEALVAGGLPILEVTLRTARAFDIVAAMSEVEGAIVGAGTVLTREQARRAVDIGCRFLVSPGAPLHLLDIAGDLPIPLLPGVATPTEAMTAAERGFRILKYFPAEAMGGTAVLKALASPFPDLRFCPTGGIDREKAKEYLALPNVICVGGSWVLPPDAIRARDYERIETLARDAAALKAGRTE